MEAPLGFQQGWADATCLGRGVRHEHDEASALLVEPETEAPDPPASPEPEAWRSSQQEFVWFMAQQTVALSGAQID